MAKARFDVLREIIELDSGEILRQEFEPGVIAQPTQNEIAVAVKEVLNAVISKDGVIDLSDIKLPIQIFREICKQLAYVTNVNTLKFNRCDLGQAHLERLSALIRFNHNVHTIELDANQFDVEEANKYLKEDLSRNANQQKIALTPIKLEEVSAEKPANSRWFSWWSSSSHIELQLVDLLEEDETDELKIGVKKQPTAEQITKGVEKYLKEKISANGVLDLSHTRLPIQLFREICKQLVDVTNVSVLKLNNCHLDHSHVLRLLQLIEGNRYIHAVEVKGNLVHDVDTSLIKDVLKNRLPVTELVPSKQAIVPTQKSLPTMYSWGLGVLGTYSPGALAGRDDDHQPAEVKLRS